MEKRGCSLAIIFSKILFQNPATTSDARACFDALTVNSENKQKLLIGHYYDPEIIKNEGEKNGSKLPPRG